MTMTQGQNFGGELGVLSLPEILGLLQMGRKSGVLSLSYADERLHTRLLFREGRVGRIQTPFAPRLSEVLLGLGVTRAVLEGGSGETWVERLSAQLPADTLRRALHRRLEAGLLPIFNLERGHFDFRNEGTEGYLEPGVDLTPLMLELARRSDELEGRVGRGGTLSPLARFRGASDPRGFEERGGALEPQGWSLLAELGEGHSLQELMQRGWAWDTLLPLTLDLEQRGLIESADDPTPVQALEGGRLREGVGAPFFVLPALGGGALALGALRGKRTMLSFFRHAGCPFCNLRVHRLMQSAPALREAGLSLVGVFGSPLEHLEAHVGRLEPDFPLLSDPDDLIHDLYGCERSVWHSLRMHFSRDYREGVRLGTSSMKTLNGEFTRLPAEFLIGPDLRVERVYYGAHASDHLPLEGALAWASSGHTGGAA